MRVSASVLEYLRDGGCGSRRRISTNDSTWKCDMIICFLCFRWVLWCQQYGGRWVAIYCIIYSCCWRVQTAVLLLYLRPSFCVLYSPYCLLGHDAVSVEPVALFYEYKCLINTETEVKSLLYASWRRMRRRGIAPLTLILALDVGQWSASRSGRFTPR